MTRGFWKWFTDGLHSANVQILKFIATLLLIVVTVSSSFILGFYLYGIIGYYVCIPFTLIFFFGMAYVFYLGLEKDWLRWDTGSD